MLPNFFMVGAAKCGTSSMFHYLLQNPDLFIPESKEPKYYSAQFLDTDFKGPGDEEVKDYVSDFAEYQSLFDGAAGRKAIGDASSDNLYYHQGTIPLIKDVAGDPKIIILLRNPVDRAYSAYTHLRRDTRETLSFEKALDVERQRILNNYHSIWHYRQCGFYYNAVKDYLCNFSDVLIVLFDELENDSQECVSRVFDFLGVDPLATVDTSKIHNPSGIPSLTFVNRFLKRPNAVKTFIKNNLSGPLLRAAKEQALGWNMRRIPIAEQTKERLESQYREDVLRLSEFLGRDLGQWVS